jgi:rhodanese-related sulfurtransferase
MRSSNLSRIIMIFLFSFILLCVSYAADKKDETIMKNISSLEADKMIKAHANDPSYVILDVRTPDEFKEGHIKNALNIDYRSQDFREKINKLDKNKTYLVYCRSGHRSGESSKIMAELGFKNIYNFGGIIDWKAAGFMTVK